jgi:phospholipid-binding lipoprotein MlaA
MIISRFKQIIVLLSWVFVANSYCNLAWANNSYIKSETKKHNKHSVKTKNSRNQAKASKYNIDEDNPEDLDFTLQSAQSKINDPFELLNRKTYGFNRVVDSYLAKPIVTIYQKFPNRIRISLRNVLNNLSAPISAINSFAQGNLNNGFATTSSFLINSTVGIFGIFDIAKTKGIVYNNEDFGRTLRSYGAPVGPYVVLPILGPSSGVDFLGMAVERTLSPLDFNLLEIGKNQAILESGSRAALNAVGIVDKREELDSILQEVEANSFDSYATIRSAYLQRRLVSSK